MTSTDASDKMLKQAWKIRWQRRKEEAFDNWGKLNDATNKLYIVLVSKHILVLPKQKINMQNHRPEVILKCECMIEQLLYPVIKRLQLELCSIYIYDVMFKSILTPQYTFLLVIEEGNWLALNEASIDVPEGGFDAVICLGNSFAHLPDFQGDLQNQKLAIQNFKDMLKPGGVLFIDHRNYDAILDTGKAPSRNLYYNVSCPLLLKSID